MTSGSSSSSWSMTSGARMPHWPMRLNRFSVEILTDAMRAILRRACRQRRRRLSDKQPARPARLLPPELARYPAAMNFTIALIRGDGIGPEIADEAVRVLQAVGRNHGHE